jgi:hypothetical protein
MRNDVTKQAITELINELRPRYLTAGKIEQGKVLDHIESVCPFHRKSIIRKIRKKPAPQYPKALHGQGKNHAGRPRKYDAPEILLFLRALWHATGQICSKRMEAIVPLWLTKYEQFTKTRLSLVHQVLIVQMSHSTINRLLADERKKYRVRGKATTKANKYLKCHIPIKTEQWNETRPGFLEIDTVAHCGDSIEGQYAYTVNSVDIASQWTEPRAIWGKGQRGVVKAFQSIEDSLPFQLLGADTDNGSEFLNRYLEQYLRDRRLPVEFTRSRPYKKNDNAHIEGRNFTHVRLLLGYARFDNPEVVALMNDLYCNEYSLWTNIFLPSVKLQSKERIGTKIKKHHDKAIRPCQRLLASPLVSQKNKQRLRELEQTLNPFVLQQIIRWKVKRILRVGSLHLHQGAKEPANREVTPLALRARSVTSRSTSTRKRRFTLRTGS